MRRIALVIALLLFAAPSSGVAQETPEPFDDTVQVLIDYDSDKAGQCNSVGWSLLIHEVDDDAIDMVNFLACQHELSVGLIGACIDPYPYVENSQFTEQEPGEITVMCILRFMAPNGTSVGFTVDPEDVYLYTLDGGRFQADTYAMSLWPPGIALTEQRVEGEALADITGGVGFTIPEGLETPYVVGWRPDEFEEPFPLSIVVDRTTPWPDSES